MAKALSLRQEAMTALDAQLYVAHEFASERGIKYMQYFVRSMNGEGAIETGESITAEDNESADGMGKELAHILAATARTAPTYYVEDEMMDLAVHAGESVPTMVFDEDDLPSPEGFVLLPDPLVIEDVHGRSSTARAFAWTTRMVETHNRETGEKRDVKVILVAYFTHRDDWELDSYSQQMREEGRPVPLLSLVHWMPLYLGRSWGAEIEAIWGADEPLAGSVYNWISFIMSLCLLVRQEITVLHGETPDRATQRRLARSGSRNNDKVNVVTLRRAHPETAHDEGGRKIEYTHRFPVSGHWRNQWYASLRTHKPIFIPTYIKGPEDKPLRVKNKVFLWRR